LLVCSSSAYVGGHGQDRDKLDGEVIDFTKVSDNYTTEDTPELIAKRCVDELKAKGTNVLSAKVYHWPADTVYQGEPEIPLGYNNEPCITDDLVTSIRTGSFRKEQPTPQPTEQA